MMVPFASTGTVIAVILFAAMVRGPIGVTLAPYHLSYGVRVTDGLPIVVLYVVAVCGALLISGYRNVVIFGAVNLVAVIVIAWLTVSGFASIWCAWAAVSSAAITLHLRLAKPDLNLPGPGWLGDYLRCRGSVMRARRVRGIFSRPEWLSPARRLPEADSAGGHQGHYGVL